MKQIFLVKEFKTNRYLSSQNTFNSYFHTTTTIKEFTSYADAELALSTLSPGIYNIEKVFVKE